jgi:hypothetical protein
MGFLDYALLCSKATGHDHATVFGERLADGVERFLDGGVDETAGVDDDEVGAGVVGRGLIALGAQLGEDAFGIDERFRTAERDEPDLGRRFATTFFQGRSWSAGGSRGTGCR